jgi:hypothetical protein
MHIARHIPIYLMLAAASLLPFFIYLSVPGLSEQKPLTTLYLSLLGDSQAKHAGKLLLAIIGGFTHGFVLQLSRGPDSNER